MTKKELEAEVTRLRCLLIDLVERDTRWRECSERSRKRAREDLDDARSLALRAIVFNDIEVRENWPYWLHLGASDER